MTQYLLLIHDNAEGLATSEQWDAFFEAARNSGIFRGGSEIGEREIVGQFHEEKSSAHLVGYMRFDAEEKEQVLALLKLHPVVIHGGTTELCVMPGS